MFSNNNNSQNSSMNLSDQLIALTESDEFSSCSTAILQTLQQDKHKPIYDALPLEQQKQLLKLLQQSHPGDILTEKVISQLLSASNFTHKSSLWGALRKQQVELNELKNVLITQLKTFKDSQDVINALENLIDLLENLSKAYDTFINGYNEFCQKKSASAVERKYYLQPIWLKRYAFGKNPFDRLKLKSQYYGLMPIYDKEEKALRLLALEQHSPLKVAGGGTHLVVATAGIHFKYNARMDKLSGILSKSLSLSPMLAYAVHDLDQLLQTEVTTECELVVLQQGNKICPLLASKTVPGKALGEKLEECYPHVELQGASPLKPNTLSIKTMESGLHYQILGFDHKTLQSGVIDWEKLPADFPKQIEQPQDLIEVGPYLHNIMDITALRGHTDSLVSLQNNIPMDHEAFSALFILSLLIGPADWKGDNVFLDQANRPVTIDYDMSFQYEILYKNNQHYIGIFNEMYCFTEMMKKSLHPTLREKLLAINPEALILRWLLQLQAREKMFMAFESLLHTMPEKQREQLLSVKILPDLSHRLTEQLKTLQKLLKNEAMPMQAMLENVYPILSQCYQSAVQEAKEQIDLAFAVHILPSIPIEKRLPADTRVLGQPLKAYLQAHRVEEEDYQTQRNQPLLQAIEEQLGRVDFHLLESQQKKDELTQPLEKIMGWQRLTLKQHDDFDKMVDHLPKTKALCLIQCGNVTKDALNVYLNKHRIQDFHLILQGFRGSLNVFDDVTGIDTLTLKQIQTLNIYCDKLPAVNTLHVIDCKDLTHEALKQYVINKNTFVTLKIQDCPKVNVMTLVRHDSPCKSIDVSIKNRQGDYKTIIFTREGKNLLYQALENDLGDEWLKNMIEGRQNALKDFFETLKEKMGKGVITVELLAWIERLVLWCSQSEPNECRQVLLNFYKTVDAQQRQQLYHALAKALRHAAPKFWDAFYEDIQCIQNPDGWQPKIDERQYQWFRALSSLVQKEVVKPSKKQTLLERGHTLIEMQDPEQPGKTIIKTYKLDSNVYAQLFDFKREDKPSEFSVESNHTVTSFNVKVSADKTYHFCCKFLPENMPKETLSFWIDSYLGNDAIPCGIPVKFIRLDKNTNTEITFAAYLMEDIREPIMGLTAVSFDEIQPAQFPLPIDSKSYIYNLFRTFITFPSDGKWEDVFFAKDDKGFYQLKSVDNDRVGGDETLLKTPDLVSPLLAIDAPSASLENNDVLKNFRQLDLRLWMQNITDKVLETDNYLRKLFTKAEIKEHFEDAAGIAKKIGAKISATEENENKNYSLLIFMLTDDLSEKLWARLQLVQGIAYLLSQRSLDGAFRFAFEAIAPKNWKFYQPFFTKFTTKSTELRLTELGVKRFNEFSRRYQLTIINSQNIKSSMAQPVLNQQKQVSNSSATSSQFQVSIVSGIINRNIDWEDVENTLNYEANSSKHFRETLQKHMLDAPLQTIISQTIHPTKNDNTNDKTVLTARQQLLVLRIIFILRDMSKLTQEMERKISLLLKGLSDKITRLDVSILKVLSERNLKDIFSNNYFEKLEILNLSECNFLKHDLISKQLVLLIQNVSVMQINKIHFMYYLLPVLWKFTELDLTFTTLHNITRLEINECTNLETVTLSSPTLRELLLRDNSNLRRVKTNCPALKSCDLTGCDQLDEETLEELRSKTYDVKLPLSKQAFSRDLITSTQNPNKNFARNGSEVRKLVEYMKVVMVGGINKKHMMERFCIFPKEYGPRDYGTRSIECNGQKCILQIWDTPSQKRFSFTMSTSCRGARVIFLVCKITSLETLEDLEVRMQILNQEMNEKIKNIPILMIGNGIDREDKRQFSYQGGVEFAKKIGAIGYMECSVKTGKGVEEILMKTAELALGSARYQPSGKNLGAKLELKRKHKHSNEYEYVRSESSPKQTLSREPITSTQNQNKNLHSEKSIQAKTPSWLQQAGTLFYRSDNNVNKNFTQNGPKVTNLVKHIKVVMLYISKTDIMKRFCRFTEEYGSEDYGTRSIECNGQKCILYMYDTLVEESFGKDLVVPCGGADLIFLGWNITSFRTLEDLAIHMLIKNAIEKIEKIPILIVGNVIDDEARRQFSYQDGVEFAKKIGAIGYMEYSGKTGKGVEEILMKAAELALGSARYQPSGENLGAKLELKHKHLNEYEYVRSESSPKQTLSREPITSTQNPNKNLHSEKSIQAKTPSWLQQAGTLFYRSDNNANKNFTQNGPEAMDVLKLIKIVMMGDTVGKTCIKERFCENNFNEFPPLGLTFGCKAVEYNDQEYKLQIWDIPNHKRFSHILRCYFREGRAVILVCDIRCLETLENLNFWIKEMSEEIENMPILMVGNGIDDENRRQFSYQDGVEFAKKIGAIGYMECSAKTGEGIQEIFMKATELALGSGAELEPNEYARSVSSFSRLKYIH